MKERSAEQKAILTECWRRHKIGLDAFFPAPNLRAVRGLVRRGLIHYQFLGSKGWHLRLTAAALANPQGTDVRTIWRVIAFDGSCSVGDCGHAHTTDLEAVRCPWTPTPWPEQCDLLVRQVRNPLLDRDRLFASPLHTRG